MAGQGIAGVLPPIAQIVSVLWIDDDTDSSKKSGESQDGGGSSSISAFVYFLTAVGVSLAALVAFQPLKRRHDNIVTNRVVEQHMSESIHSIEEAEQSLRKVTGMRRLFRELHWLALALSFTFVLTMFYPVFTQKILSVRDPETAPALFQPRAFVPFALFMWNLGDLSGRASTIWDFRLRHKPLAMFLVSLVRVVFLPMYLMCNIGGRGAKVDSDFFYLFVVQFLFGATNGWMGSSTMMTAIESVDEAEREAAGGFMGMCLVAGLTVGSLLSFTAGGI
jgi:equilibrative nucleoside transporter 1/2/3